MKKIWLLAATLSLLFLLFSVFTLTTEGLVVLWSEHTRNLWGNQIWIDLLSAIGIGSFLVVPQARALNMRPLPWFLLIIATGSIGFFSMIGRLLYLRENVQEGS